MAEENKQETPVSDERPRPEQFEIAILPLQNTTLFPETMVPLAAGRPALEKVGVQFVQRSRLDRDVPPDLQARAWAARERRHAHHRGGGEHGRRAGAHRVHSVHER